MDFRAFPLEIKLKILKEVRDPKEILVFFPKDDNKFWFRLCNTFADVKLKYDPRKNYFDVYKWIYNILTKRNPEVFIRDPPENKLFFLEFGDMREWIGKLALDPTKLTEKLCTSKYFASKLGLPHVRKKRSRLFDDCKEFVKPKYLKIFEDICELPRRQFEFDDTNYEDFLYPVDHGNIDLFFVNFNYEDIKHGDLIISEGNDLKIYLNGEEKDVPPKVLEEFPIQTWRTCVNNRAFRVVVNLTNDDIDTIKNTAYVQSFRNEKFPRDGHIIVSHFFRNCLKFHIVSFYIHGMEEMIGLRSYSDAASYVYPYFFTYETPINHFRRLISDKKGTFFSVSFDLYDDSNRVEYHGDPITFDEIIFFQQFVIRTLEHLNLNRILFMGDESPVKYFPR